MGAATRAHVVAAAAALAVSAAASVARADACTGTTEAGGRFATCFDLGNRLSLTGGSDGFGLELDLRHEITFDDDPDLEWKMEHVILDATHSALDGSFTGTLYRGRYLRHSRDGHVVLPLGTPKKVFVPFDIGGYAEVGTVTWRPADPTQTIGVVKTAALLDFARSRNYRRIFAIGPLAYWDVDVDRTMNAIADHVIAPFTEGIAMVRLESADGLYLAEGRVEAGTAWRSTAGWRPEARGHVDLERIVVAFNDRPVALFAGVDYDSARAETIARIGARFVLFDRADPRVSLSPLARR